MPSREYFLGGLETPEVQAYLDFQINLAVLLGAEPSRATKEMKENVEFEIKIANVRISNFCLKIKFRTLITLTSDHDTRGRSKGQYKALQ